MISTILKLRIVQALRLLKQLGFVRSVIVLGATTVLLLVFFRAAEDENVAFLGSLASVISLTTLHVARKDRQFIKIVFENTKSIFFLEYLLATLPIFLVLLIRSQWLAAALLVGATALMPFLEFSFRILHPDPKLLRWIPDDNFEWKAGVRKYFLPLSVVWFIGLLTSFFVGSVPIAVFLIGTMTMSFYDWFENVEILISKEENERTFLRKKILNHAALLLAVNLPLILAFCVFHRGLFYIPIIELALFVILLAYVVCLKYAFYTQDRDARLGQTLISLGFLGIIIPFFTPVVMLMTARYYSKAKKNLKFYLNDFD